MGLTLTSEEGLFFQNNCWKYENQSIVFIAFMYLYTTPQNSDAEEFDKNRVSNKTRSSFTEGESSSPAPKQVSGLS